MNISKATRAILVCILTSFLFGLSFIFIRMCVTEVSVFSMLSWRHIVAIIAMTVCIKIGLLDVHLKGKDLKPLLFLSFFQPVMYYIFESIGVKLTTASESGIIVASIPIVTMIFSAIFLKDKPTKIQAVCIVITVAGAVIAAGVGGIQASSSVLGYICLMLAVFCDGVFSITTQKIQGFTSAEKTYVMCCCGTVVFTLCALIENMINGTIKQFITLPFTDSGFLICLLYLALGCNILAFLCMNYSISIIGATRRSAFAGLSTVITIVASVIILNESVSSLQIIAAVLILSGVTGANFAGRKKISCKTPGEEDDNSLREDMRDEKILDLEANDKPRNI